MAKHFFSPLIQEDKDTLEGMTQKYGSGFSFKPSQFQISFVRSGNFTKCILMKDAGIQSVYTGVSRRHYKDEFSIREGQRIARDDAFGELIEQGCIDNGCKFDTFWQLAKVEDRHAEVVFERV